MLVENSGLESKKAPSANEELVKHENDRQLKYLSTCDFYDGMLRCFYLQMSE